MKIDINDEEGKIIIDILNKQIEKTSWVIENKNVSNESFLEKRIEVMHDLIKQIERGMGIYNLPLDDDSLEIDGI